MALPEEDIDSYLSRRAKQDESWVFLKHTSVSRSYGPSRPFQLGNLPSLLADGGIPQLASRHPHLVDEPSRDSLAGSKGDATPEVDTADPVVSALPRTPVKVSEISVSDKTVSAARSRKVPSPRRIALTRPKRVIPTLNIIQSSPIDAFSPVASSTPAKPPMGKVVEESPLLGKRRRNETDPNPKKSTKPKSKDKYAPVDPAPVHTSPIETPHFDTSAPIRKSKRPRESGGSPSPQPKSKALRSSVVPTSPINSAVFPPNTELPPILGRQGSLTVSSGQLFKKPQDDRVIKIKSRLPPPAEISVADTSVIESFDTSPPKPPIIAKKAGPVDNEKKPRVPVKTAAAETSLLTSPETSPEKRSTLAPQAPPLSEAAQRPQVKKVIADSTITNLTSPENSREESASIPKNITKSNPPLSGQTAKTEGITKLRPAATTIPNAEAGPSKVSFSTMPLRSRSTLGQTQTKKNPIIPVKRGKDKPAKMTPVEYAEMLIEKYSNPNRKFPNVSQHLRGRKIFYAGVDMRYAGDATKKKMEYVRTLMTSNLAPLTTPSQILNHGGTLVPRYDPEIVTVIVTDGSRFATSQACGIKQVTDIPMTIPTVRWEWVLTGDRQVRKRPTVPGAPPPKPTPPVDDKRLPKMGYYFYHAAFSERIEAGDDIPKRQAKPAVQKELTVEDLDNWDMGIR